MLLLLQRELFFLLFQGKLRDMFCPATAAGVHCHSFPLQIYYVRLLLIRFLLFFVFFDAMLLSSYLLLLLLLPLILLRAVLLLL